jgi:hypothetical protein
MKFYDDRPHSIKIEIINYNLDQIRLYQIEERMELSHIRLTVTLIF